MLTPPLSLTQRSVDGRWVPLNESWGVPGLKTDQAQQDYRESEKDCLLERTGELRKEF